MEEALDLSFDRLLMMMMMMMIPIYCLKGFTVIQLTNKKLNKYLLIIKFSHLISTHKFFYIKTFKIAPTFFDPKIIFRELHYSLLPEDDLRIETCWSDFKCFNIKKCYVCALIGVLIK